MDFSTPGFPLHYQLPELTQTHVDQVSDAIQPWGQKNPLEKKMTTQASILAWRFHGQGEPGGL